MIRYPEAVVSVSKRNFVDGSARRFKAEVGGETLHGFVVRRGDLYFAYQNKCQHLPVTLDLNDGKFFTHDKSHLQCHLHGAMYEIESGLCIAGPCLGASLVRLELEEQEDRLVIRFPPEAY